MTSHGVYDPGLPGDVVAAGGYKRIRETHPVSQLFRSPAEYGPSFTAYTSWKRSGIPTSETMQTSTFGRSSNFGSLQPERSGKAPLSHVTRAVTRNPISWVGFEDEEPRRGVGHPGVASQSEVTPQPTRGDGIGGDAPTWQAPPAPAKALRDEQMGQTWAELMRSGSIKPSAALSMVDLPKEYSVERPPPLLPPMMSSMHAIGLQPQHAGRPVYRSSNFTSQFSDPTLYF